MADVISNVNQQLLGAINLANIGNVVGWIVFAVIVIGGAFMGLLAYRNKKIFNKKITAFEIVGIYFQPVYRDVAKVVKLGSGGFEILYLRKMKVYRIAYGGKVGRDTYYFFIGKDGYWYNGMLSANINKIDEQGGLIPIVTTNPNMRAQYTSLEKQIDALHAAKKSFMEQYGTILFSIGFILIVGVLAWLIFKEFNNYMGGMTVLTEKTGALLDRANSILASAEITSRGGTGLIPAGGSTVLNTTG